MSSELRRIYLVRHAESIWNEERRIQGSCLDVPLSDTGRNQARMLGLRLGELSFGSVYSSDAVRALDELPEPPVVKIRVCPVVEGVNDPRGGE